MRTLLRPGNRVLLLAVLVAMSAAAFPRLIEEVHGHRALGTFTMADTTKSFPLGRAFLFGAPAATRYGDECEMSGSRCETHVMWNALATDLGLVAVLAAVGRFVDRRWQELRARRAHRRALPKEMLS